jgi:hypothetical protein
MYSGFDTGTVPDSRHRCNAKFVLFSAQYIWETKNKGKLWKDIRGKYETAEE